ncbi:MAG: hypothetical protein H3C41_07275 [Bacteroidales bacterium]|nr:hypothetical protein [Bacteroidales bacterium]
MDTNFFLELIGYLASAIIALSMALNSIAWFRIVNLIGAALFSIYGFVIGAFPVGIMNAFIVAVDVYYLVRIFGTKEHFHLLEVRPDDGYMLRFIRFHQQDIHHFFPDFHLNADRQNVYYFVLRNMVVAGLFVGNRTEGGHLEVLLDYVTPAYRDFKNGRFVYDTLKEIFAGEGIQHILAETTHPRHQAYLLHNGFVKGEGKRFTKEL